MWARFEHVSLAALQAQSARFIEALRRRSAGRLEAAPPRRPLPAEWTLDLQRPLQGAMIFLRRTNEHGEIRVLGHPSPARPPGSIAWSVPRSISPRDTAASMRCVDGI